LELEGVSAGDRREAATRWLTSVHLDRWADAHPHELSAGMRQRAALARALAADPEVLLGDEPFGALDAQAREILQNEVQRVWVESEGRKTFLFVTHNVREAVVLADRVFVMSAAPGRLLEEFRIHTQRPRELDDVLVSRVVTEIHELLMQEVDASVAREMAR
jgi:NitT/TauT family transport system ATP-binding protein